MKKFLLAICAFSMLLAQTSFSQRTCSTMDVLEHRISQNSEIATNLEAAERRAAEWKAANPDFGRSADDVVYIPVVVHVVYIDSSVENISEAQIMSQIDVLNEDFRRHNPDSVNTRPEFQHLASDVGVEFCMADKDPDGNQTTGITRTQGDGGFFGFFDPFTNSVKANSTGGKDPWPADQYLNIWVCNLGFFGLLGYAQFPGDDPATDGIVIDYRYFGTTGTVTAPFDNGRTTTHEVGHWLGLFHVWGDGDCSMDDMVDDTPDAEEQSQGCNFTKAGCGSTDMIENFMDYSDDGCMNMFTHGQSARIWSFLDTDPARNSVISSPGCYINTGIGEYQNVQTIKTYPNPSSGQVYVDLSKFRNETSKIEVRNLLGEIVWSGQSKAKTGTTLDLTEQPAGTYILTVKTGSQTAEGQIIIQK